jgi:DNA polymerase-3 subunit alpha
MLTNVPTFTKVADRIIAMIEGAPLVISHNASFDQEVLDIEAARLGRQIHWPRLLCTVEQTVHLTGKRLTLTDLHNLLFEEKFADAHRAKADTQALIRCCRELVRRGEL